MLGNRQSQHSFAQIPSVNMARSQFDRSHTVKDTIEFDTLNPIMVDEVIPGDTANLTLKSFVRLATQKVPILDNLYMDYFFFFVPSRLVWTNWERFNGAQDDPADSTDFILPTITAPTVTGFEVGTIYDKMGLPTGVASLLINNALPLRCYNKIYNAWFRDQNLQDSIVDNMDDGPDAVADYALKKRGKRHDYFTSCLPWAQKGDAVTLPFGTQAPVAGLYYKGTPATKPNDGTAYDAAGNTIAGGGQYVAPTDGTPVGYALFDTNAAVSASNLPQIYADLTTATAVTINQLREAWQIQSLLELDARGGTRYVEILQAHFNVTSPDFRLQRPEYLGGGSVRFNVHPVAVSATTAVDEPGKVLGELGAFATASTLGQNIGFTKSFTEHGYVIGLCAARADLTYQQGLHKTWSRSTRYDFFWPKLQELGEQAVLNKEIYAQGTAADEEVFGYQERFAEYRFKPSEIRGEFRSTYATPIDQWHMAQEFGALPVLNGSFIESSTPIERANALAEGPQILMDMWFDYKQARPMLTYSVPSTIGRF